MLGRKSAQCGCVPGPAWPESVEFEEGFVARGCIVAGGGGEKSP